VEGLGPFASLERMKGGALLLEVSFVISGDKLLGGIHQTV
jgi:hypothetical protein